MLHPSTVIIWHDFKDKQTLCRERVARLAGDILVCGGLEEIYAEDAALSSTNKSDQAATKCFFRELRSEHRFDPMLTG